MTFAALVTRVQVEGGADTTTSGVTAATVKARLNDRYRQLVSWSKWNMASVSLGMTVIGQAEYALPSNVVDLAAVKVGTTPYARAGQEDLWSLTAGRTRLGGDQGIFAPDYTAAGVHQIELYPVPTAAGDEITGLASVIPADLVNDSDIPIIPEDFHYAIAEGAVADLLAFVDERPEQAVYFEERFAKAVDGLTRRKNSRIGSGPSQVAVAGYHF